MKRQVGNWMLNTELEKLVAETNLLSTIKQNVAKAQQNLKGPLHIAQECLFHRDGREGYKNAHDNFEKNLLIELDNLQITQKKMKELYVKVVVVVACM